MSNPRTSVKMIFSTLHKACYTSSSSVNQELLRHIHAGNKGESEKLFNLLPYLQGSKNEPTRMINEIGTFNGDGKETNNSLVTGHSHLMSQTPAETFGEKVERNNASEDPTRIPTENSTAPIVIHNTLKSLPTVFVAPVKALEAVDLNNAMLPLSLHLKGNKSLMLDAVVAKNVKHAYLKTSTALNMYYVAGKEHSKTVYKLAVDLVNQPATLKDLVRFQANNFPGSSLIVSEKRLNAIYSFEVNQLIDKIKSMLKSLFDLIDQKLKQKAPTEKKPGHEKEKPEKTPETEEKK